MKQLHCVSQQQQKTFDCLLRTIKKDDEGWISLPVFFFYFFYSSWLEKRKTLYVTWLSTTFAEMKTFFLPLHFKRWAIEENIKFYYLYFFPLSLSLRLFSEKRIKVSYRLATHHD
jgi:hypothetical protein